MSTSPGACSKTRSTSQNESERTARYEKRSTPQSATVATTAAATVAALSHATTDTTVADTTYATVTDTIDVLSKCQAPRCQRIDANYAIFYYNELGEEDSQEICWCYRQDLKNSRKYRGGS